jgi:lipopolysaccharide export system permease protein
MANQSEIVAILASGVSYYRLLVPYLVVGVLLAGGDLYMKNYLIPRAYNKVNIFEQKYVLQGYNFFDRNIHRQLNKNTYFYMQNFDYVNSVGYKFALEKFQNGKLVEKLQATEARYDTIAQVWRLRDLLIRRINGLDEKLVRQDSLTLKLPITRAEFGQKVRNVPSMITPELTHFIAREKFKGETLINFYLIEKYKRTSLPFAIIVLVMIAVAIATRKIRGGMGSHLLIGILIAVSYELSMRFSTTLSTNANFPPLLAVWVPNIIYIGLAVYLLIKTPK